MNELQQNLQNIRQTADLKSNEKIIGPKPAVASDVSNIFVNHIIKGFIEVGKPKPMRGNCNDAWQVYAAAGPGFGKIVYGVGYALSPTGKLIPDRGSVSDSAEAAWEKVSASSRKRKRLDDQRHQHDRVGNEYHTDDPSDDCKVLLDFQGKDRQFLNYSYESEGWEKGLLSQLQANHESVISALNPEILEVSELEKFLAYSSQKFFEKHYFT
jgi:hypothetical protein